MRDLSDRQLERLFQLDDRPGPARPVDDARLAAIIAGALGAAGFPAPIAAATSSAAQGSAGAAKAAGGAAKGLAAGKLAVIAGGVAAVAVAGWAVLRPPREHAPVVKPVVESVAVLETASPPPVELEAPDIGDREPQATVQPTPGKITQTKPARRAHASRAAPKITAAATQDLLAAANAARAAHRWREADQLYARVVSGGAAELAVQAALVASASLHLEHLGDPSGALRRFRAALAAGLPAALAEDARWGLAESARATGDTVDEAAALDDFLTYHAGSPRAVRARARRAELRSSP